MAIVVRANYKVNTWPRWSRWFLSRLTIEIKLDKCKLIVSQIFQRFPSFSLFKRAIKVSISRFEPSTLQRPVRDRSSRCHEKITPVIKILLVEISTESRGEIRIFDRLSSKHFLHLLNGIISVEF